MSDPQLLAGTRVALVGRFAGTDQKTVAEIVRAHGGEHVDEVAAANLVVVGEHGLPFDEPRRLEQLLSELGKVDEGAAPREVIAQTEFWERLGLVDQEGNVHRLYTPRMLASLVGVDVAVIRRWQRLGLIRPAREVLRLPYFDFQEVATARRLVELLAAGVPPREIKRQLAALGRYLPRVERPLAQLSVMLAGKELLLRQGDGLVEPGGQLRFDFDQLEETNVAEASTSTSELSIDRSAEPEELLAAAHAREDAGDLPGAIECYRAALAAAGPNPRWVFELAELLYAVNDLPAARERYYMAIELDEDFVEARANLGCVLAESGETALAVAALRGALQLHPDFPDAHFHLATALEQLNSATEARHHWETFLALAPESPWAETARQRLE
jgi:tetratricopeptide (TPR) repeat protein